MGMSRSGVLGDLNSVTTFLENPTIATVPETQAALGSTPVDLYDITASVEVAVAVDSSEIVSSSLPLAAVTPDMKSLPTIWHLGLSISISLVVRK